MKEIENMFGETYLQPIGGGATCCEYDGTDSRLWVWLLWAGGAHEERFSTTTCG